MVQYILLLCVALGGYSGLGWELIWQLHASHAIGISAQATALILAGSMGAMAIGSLAMGTWLDRGSRAPRPFLLYGLLELCIGMFGLGVTRQFTWVAELDRLLYHGGAPSSPATTLALVLVVLGPPALAMGATIPIFGLLARAANIPIGLVYGVHTFGAATGILAAAFVLLPAIGVSSLGAVLACTNLSIGVLLTWVSLRLSPLAANEAETGSGDPIRLPDYALAMLSGCAVFALEVLWFRAPRSAFLSTTASFAVMLATVLVSLAIGSYCSVQPGARALWMGPLLGVAAWLLLLGTPLMERVDIFSAIVFVEPNFTKFLLTFGLAGPVTVVLGMIFPLLLARCRSPREYALIHATNTTGAILGAILAAWALLPVLGFSSSCLVVSALLLFSGIARTPGPERLRIAAIGAACAVFAVVGRSGIGHTESWVSRLRTP